MGRGNLKWSSEQHTNDEIRLKMKAVLGTWESHPPILPSREPPTMAVVVVFRVHGRKKKNKNPFSCRLRDSFLFEVLSESTNITERKKVHNLYGQKLRDKHYTSTPILYSSEKMQHFNSSFRASQHPPVLQTPSRATRLPHHPHQPPELLAEGKNADAMSDNRLISASKSNETSICGLGARKRDCNQDWWL